MQALIADSYQRLAATARVNTHQNVLAERPATQQAHGTGPGRVLSVCTPNPRRSQIAAALLAHRAPGQTTLSFAGTDPAAQVEPDLAQALAEGAQSWARPTPSR